MGKRHELEWRVGGAQRRRSKHFGGPPSGARQSQGCLLGGEATGEAASGSSRLAFPNGEKWGHIDKSCPPSTYGCCTSTVVPLPTFFQQVQVWSDH